MVLSRAQIFAAALLLYMAGVAGGQESQPLSAEAQEQILVDLDALILGTSATLRCAVYNSDLPYLSPLEATGAEIRIDQLEAVLSAGMTDLADRVAEMRAQAAAVPCGNQGLLPFLEFSQQAGEDIVDIGVLAWQTIRFDNCSYFADDDFMRAVSRAQNLAVDFPIDGDEARVAYISDNAQAWSALFQDNCFNPAFDPTQTLPGMIALALPTD